MAVFAGTYQGIIVYRVRCKDCTVIHSAANIIPSLCSLFLLIIAILLILAFLIKRNFKYSYMKGEILSLCSATRRFIFYMFFYLQNVFIWRIQSRRPGNRSSNGFLLAKQNKREDEVKDIRNTRRCVTISKIHLYLFQCFPAYILF